MIFELAMQLPRKKSVTNRLKHNSNCRWIQKLLPRTRSDITCGFVQSKMLHFNRLVVSYPLLKVPQSTQ